MHSFSSDIARLEAQTATALPAFSVHLFTRHCTFHLHHHSPFPPLPPPPSPLSLLIPKVLIENTLLNSVLLRVLTVGNVLNESTAMGLAAG